MNIVDYCFSEQLTNLDDFYYIALCEKQQHKKQSKSYSILRYQDQLATLVLFKVILGLVNQTHEQEIYQAKLSWWKQQLAVMLNHSALANTQYGPPGLNNVSKLNNSFQKPEHQSSEAKHNNFSQPSTHPLVEHLSHSQHVEKIAEFALKLIVRLESQLWDESPQNQTVTTKPDSSVLRESEKSSKTSIIDQPITHAVGHSINFALNSFSINNSALSNEKPASDQHSLELLFGSYWLTKHRIRWKSATFKQLLNPVEFESQKRTLHQLINSTSGTQYPRNTKIYLRLIKAWLNSNKTINNNTSSQFEPSPLNKLFQYWLSGWA